MKRAAALGAVIVAIPLLVTSAVAHGGPCRAAAVEPRVEQESIIGNGRFNCAADHATARMRVCLQKRIGDAWDSRDCRTFQRSGVTGIQAETTKFCHEGLWRTRIRGRALNDAGDVVHRDVDVSPELRIRNC